MTTKIQIVLNPDRCHVSQDGQPIATFLFSDYQIPGMSNKEAAVTIAKSFAYNKIVELSDFYIVETLPSEYK